MRSTLFATAAIAAALALPATAIGQQQSTTKSRADQQQAAESPKAQTGAARNAQGMQASNIIGQDTYSANGEEVGEVKDLLVDQNGRVTAAVVDVGGFLGIGSKQVAIDFKQLKMDPQDDKITVSMSKQQLQQAPEFQQSAAADSDDRPDRPRSEQSR